MEYLSDDTASTTTGFILCCECGTQIEPNATNMCVACVRIHVDITEGIPKQSSLYFCRNCERYLQPPGTWVRAVLESRELLSVCLKKLKELTKVRLVDAGFIWTEPHSKRLKVKLTIQKEVLNGAVLQQVFVVEFTVNNQMCDDCHRVEAKDYWKAVVQVRQKTSHKKTLFYLEQLILKHGAHAKTVSIKEAQDGIDFFYAQKQDGRKLVEFLNSVVPSRYQTSQRLISHDIHNNIHNYKNTFSVEIVPICKDNVVCLPPKLARSMGNIGQICVCSSVTQVIHLIDPNTLKVADVSGPVFWREPFESLCTLKHLTEYVVLEIEASQKTSHYENESKKHVMADVWVAKSSELGSDQQTFCHTHLGHLLNVGDTVLGFDMKCTNVNNKFMDKIPEDKLPDVVLVKKVFGDKVKRNKKRKWKLKHVQDFGDSDSVQRDYTDFLEDLEEDPAYRQNVNIYVDHDKIGVDTDDTDDDDAPRITLQEMLDDLHLDADATGEEGAEMIQ